VKLIFVADVHLANHRQFGGEVVGGVNDRARRISRALAATRHLTEALRCDDVVVCGDLFDASHPSPQLVALFHHALVPRATHPVVIVGNHDMASADDGDHALVSIGASGVARVCTSLSSYGGSLLAIAYQPGDARVWVREAITRFAGRDPCDVVATHVGVYDDDDPPPPFLSEARDAIPLSLARWVMREVGARVFVAGNWHDHKVWRVEEGLVVIPGSLCPVGFGEDRGFHGAVVYDSDAEPGSELEAIEIPGPRFVTLTDPREVPDVIVSGRDEHRILDDYRSNWATYARWVVGPSDAVVARESLRELRETADLFGVRADGVVHVTSDASRAQARAAADAARSSGDILTAVEKYALECPTPEEVHESEAKGFHAAVADIAVGAVRKVVR
jgi:DNA repair exonuclease SbcCD nuclease subunit